MCVRERERHRERENLNDLACNFLIDDHDNYHYTLTHRLHTFSICCTYVSKGGISPRSDHRPGFLSKLYLTSFVGTDIVFKDGRYLVLYNTVY